MNATLLASFSADGMEGYVKRKAAGRGHGVSVRRLTSVFISSTGWLD